MARSIQVIYNALIAEKNSMGSLTQLQPNVDDAQTLLSDVNSSSKVADWRLWLWIVAFATHLLEIGRDAFNKEIDSKVAAAKSHSLRWYREQALAFQLGDALTFNAELQVYEYPADNPSAQIITRAATEEVPPYVVVKVAKEDSEPLAAGEKSAFEDYIDEVKDAGTPVLVVSELADVMRLTLDVYYDPQVLSSTGELITESGTYPVEEAIESYIANLSFNGRLIRSRLIDVIQAAAGVEDPVMTSLEVSTQSDPAFQEITTYHKTYSGHYRFDSANSSINYIPYA